MSSGLQTGKSFTLQSRCRCLDRCYACTLAGICPCFGTGEGLEMVCVHSTCRILIPSQGFGHRPKMRIYGLDLHVMRSDFHTRSWRWFSNFITGSFWRNRIEGIQTFGSRSLLSFPVCFSPHFKSLFSAHLL
jgi:hypothetical protein